MKDTVINAQLAHARILKPPRDFEDAYQGLDAAEIPIAIPGTLDFRAGERGFDPQLMAGISIPLGSRLLLWLPQSLSVEGIPTVPYIYRILWRLRSQSDSAEARARNLTREGNPQGGLSGHLPTQLKGIPADDGAAPGDPDQERVVIPCALSTIAYEQTEPGGAFDDATTNLRGERLSVRGQSYFPPGEAPILVNDPTLKAVASQGVYPFPATPPGLNGGPTYIPFETDALGDEYIILVTRDPGTTDLWDFATDDFAFSRLFGTANGTRAPVPSIGIYAMEGSGAV